MYQSVNPATGEFIAEYPQHSDAEMNQIIEQSNQAWAGWKKTSFTERRTLLLNLARLFEEQAETLGKVVTQEMGKIYSEAVAEVKKSGTICEYYANQGEEMLADEVIEAGFGRSYTRYEPMGIVLAVMPWNFPFWQAIRFIAPNLMGGNACLLKHAPNVFGCALEIKRVVEEAGFPKHLFDCLLIEPSQVALALEDPKVKAVTLTGSEGAGMAVAQKAGKELKKAVMELGGSDPFIVLDDADLDRCCQTSVKARCYNAGQVCISAKRMIVVESQYDAFVKRHQQIMEELNIGDPMLAQTDMGPMARADLRDELHRQVQRSLSEGARLVTGGHLIDGPGNFYAPTLLADVTPEMTCFTEELFGPVSCVIKAKDTEEAIKLANQSPYGLGASIWSQDVAKAEQLAHQIESGLVFVNGMTTSHPALPFGGVKRSGFGRECSHHGIREFQQVKTVVIS